MNVLKRYEYEYVHLHEIEGSNFFTLNESSLKRLPLDAIPNISLSLSLSLASVELLSFYLDRKERCDLTLFFESPIY